MLIASIGYPLLPVGVASAGGAEQIISLLDHALTEAGHQSLVVAAEGSRTFGQLFPTIGSSKELTAAEFEQVRQVHFEAVRAVLSMRIDLVHFHGIDFERYLPLVHVPAIATLHGPRGWYRESIFKAPNVSLVCVSGTQARTMPDNLGIGVIENGIDLTRYRRSTAKGGQLVMLARICPEKGIHIALRIARRMDMPLIIAGPLHPFHRHREYFARHVVPLLDSRRRYVGPLDTQQKIALLAQARCVLVPSVVPETSSLVAMEALASGVPVVAFEVGALPEVVEHGVTGFVTRDEGEMMIAITRLGEISPDMCRARAELRFDSRRMSRQYFACYQSTIQRFPGTAQGYREQRAM